VGYQGILVDVEYCSGCQSCVLACQQEKGYSAEQYGIVVSKLGPLFIEKDRWEYDYIPQFTDFCDLCVDRVAKGKKPACVHHCQAQCLEYGDICDLANNAPRRKSTIIAIREG
jgi:anaerobic dimethyl sulfoxide reductase subunit B (iron-sulfur subunit)